MFSLSLSCSFLKNSFSILFFILSYLNINKYRLAVINALRSETKQGHLVTILINSYSILRKKLSLLKNPLSKVENRTIFYNRKYQYSTSMVSIFSLNGINILPRKYQNSPSRLSTIILVQLHYIFYFPLCRFDNC